MKLTSRATYRIIRYALEKRRFRQLDIAKAEKVAFSRVNKVVNWLLSRGYVAKGKEGYYAVAPAAIANLFALNRKMEELRVASFDVEVDRKMLLKLLGESGAALCLTSALAHYSDYFRDPGIYAYSEDKELPKQLSGLGKGYTHIELYRDDIGEKSDFVKKGKMLLTSELRTIIDLFCSNKAYANEQLVKRKWAR